MEGKRNCYKREEKNEQDKMPINVYIVMNSCMIHRLHVSFR